MIYSFTWNGTNCREKGVRLQSMPPVIRPEERVGHVTIPGRAGEMTLTEGDDIYNSYIQTIPMAVKTEENVRAVEAWLRGEGYVTFSGQPDLKQKARVINAVNFQKHGRNSVWWDGEVQFYCDPIKHAVTENAIEVTTSGATVTNAGDLRGYPRIAITGSGIVTVASGGATLTLPDCVDGWVIDCENEWILSGNTPQMNACSGNFPIFNPGENVVTFTGATKLTITPNWRYL
jgi:phage-related protein